MKKELLLELLKKIKENKLLLDGINEMLKTKEKTVFEMLFTLSDSEVENILMLESDKLKLFQIYFCLNKMEIPVEIRITLEQELIKQNENLYATIPILSNKEILNREDGLSFIDIIINGNPVSILSASELIKKKEIIEHVKALQIIGEIANCEKDYLVDALCKAVSNSNLLKREDVLNFLYVIARSNGEEQARYASDLATNPKILKKNCFEALEFVKAIAYAKEDYQARNAYIVAKNNFVLTKENALEFVRVVADTFGESKCSYVKDTAICDETLRKENAISYVKAVSSSKEEQVRATMLSATNSVALKNPNSLEFVMEIGHARGEKQAGIAYLVASDITLKNRKDLIKIVKIIANSMGEKQAELAYNLCLFNGISNRKDMLEYIKLIANVKNEDNVYHAFSTIKARTCLESLEPLKIISMIANANTDYQAFYTSEAANSFELISNQSHIQVLNEISKSIGEVQANVGYEIAVNPHFMRLSNFLDYVRLFTSSTNQEQLYITYNICLYILTMKPEILEHQQGLKCIEKILNTPASILNKCQTQIFINPEISSNQNIQAIYKEIEKETEKMIRVAKVRKNLNENSINILINSISKLEIEDVSQEDIGKVKVK